MFSNADLESPVIPHHDQSRSTFPPILFLEATLGVGVVLGFVGLVVFVVASQVWDFAGPYHQQVQVLSGALGFLAPIAAGLSKLGIDWLVAAGFFLDIGDGVIRNAKFIETEKPVPTTIRAPVTRPSQLKVLDPEMVRRANLKVGETFECHTYFLPVWWGGNALTHHGTDGVFFGALASWTEKDGVVFLGARPPRGFLGQRPGRRSANGRKWDMDYVPWDIPWRWVPPLVNRAGAVLRPGRWTAPLPYNLLLYLESCPFAAAAGASPGHQRRTTWWGGVPKLYRTGFVKVAYSERPPDSGKEFRVQAEVEKNLIWALQANLNKSIEDGKDTTDMLSGTAMAARIGVGAVHGGEHGGSEPYGVGPQGPT